MAEASAIPRKLVIFGIVIPLALLLGYVLATPGEFTMVSLVGLVVMVLSVPVLLKHHHFLLIMTWNAAMNIYFFPGQPEIWMLTAGISLFFTILDRLMNKEQPVIYVPSVVWALVFIALVALVTVKLRGGLGIRALGSTSHGGRRLIYIVAAIIGYFALTGQRIPVQRALRDTTVYFLSAVTAVVSNLAYFAGPSFYFLFYLFPALIAYSQVLAEYSVVGAGISRITGIALGAPAISYVILLRYGLRGMLTGQISKLWRVGVYLAMVLLSMYGGYRSSVVLAGVLFISLFILEGLYRTRLMLVFLVAGVIGGATLVTQIQRLPLPLQRSLSVLPLDVDPRAKYDAETSTTWRLEMWRLLVPQIPEYFWLGKGYAIDPTEVYLMQEATQRGMDFGHETTIASGNYHSGPLTIIIPLGIWGAIGFLWFVVAALRLLYRNYAHGPPELRTINNFLLAYFITRLIYFLFVYGHFAEELFIFTGIVGLSASVNGGMREPEELEAKGGPALNTSPSAPVLRPFAIR